MMSDFFLSDNMWKVIEPTKWPDPPQWVSFSTLTKLEQCPRKWALSNASYSNLWEGKGYPPKLHLPAIEGTIIHSTIEFLMNHLLRQDSASGIRPDVTRALREMGGYTQLLTDHIHIVLAPFQHNPRTTQRMGSFRRQLIAKLPELRFQVQTLSSNLTPLPSAPKSQHVFFDCVRERGALPSGTYTEVALEAPELRWRGVVDLLKVSESSAEIMDFKTGEAKSDHELQVRLYALLWMKDKQLNPQQRTVNKITLTYPSYFLEVPVPTVEDLNLLETELLHRTKNAMDDCARVPPLAKPRADICKWCDVRHLCNEYWEALSGLSDENRPVEGHYYDIQVRLVGKAGLTSWMAIVEKSSCIQEQVAVMVRLPGEENRSLLEGQSLRLLDVFLSCNQEVDTEKALMMIQVSGFSEIFHCSVVQFRKEGH